MPVPPARNEQLLMREVFRLAPPCCSLLCASVMIAYAVLPPTKDVSFSPPLSLTLSLCCIILLAACIYLYRARPRYTITVFGERELLSLRPSAPHLAPRPSPLCAEAPAD